MFDWLTKDNDDAIEMLKHDHKVVKELFDQFEKTTGRAAKSKILRQALTELKIHAALEEEIFYAAVRRRVGKDIMNEADEEHHVAKLLIAELDDMHGHGDHHDAKFKVLAENVRHHIKEEENEMLPKVKALKLDLNKLGREMRRRKKELIAKGVPPVGEEKMVAATHGAGDSPVKAAHKTRKTRPVRKRTAA